MMLMVSPTGARHSKADHPALPVSVPEIVAATRDCVTAGADALHLHIRDDKGMHSLDTGLYSEALAEIGNALPTFPVQITTEAAGRFSYKDQLHLLSSLKPRWASVSLREVGNDAAQAREIVEVCRENNTQIQHIIYDRLDADRLRRWQALGVLSEKESVILVAGNYRQKRPADPDDVTALLAVLPPVERWMLCAFGPTEHACLVKAASLGGDVRVGFENSLTRADGTPWPTMAASVASLVQKIGKDTCRTFSHAI